MKNLPKYLCFVLILTSLSMPIIAQKEVRNSQGKLIYKIDADGTVRSANNKIMGTYKEGTIRDNKLRQKASTNGAIVKSSTGKTMGTVTSSTIYDSKNRPIATKDDETIRINNKPKYIIK